MGVKLTKGARGARHARRNTQLRDISLHSRMCLVTSRVKHRTANTLDVHSNDAQEVYLCDRAQNFTDVHQSKVGAACVQSNGARHLSYGAARVCPHRPASWRAVSSCSSLLTLRLLLFVCSSFLLHLQHRGFVTHAIRVFTTPGAKNRMVWVFFFVLLYSPQSSDSDRGPPMRGVDNRGGGFSGNSGNPPPAGGRGRGMVLPAWLVAQQNAQMAGPVSFFLLLQQPGQAVRWLTTEVNRPSRCCGRDIG